MIPQLEKLNEGEMQLMLKAPILVCILIAGADGNIDKKEIKEAIRIASEKTRSGSILSRYLKLVAEDFEDKVMVLIQNYPYDPVKRAPILVRELSELSQILVKLDAAFSSEFYRMLKELARRVASSSGGLLGYKSVGTEEARYVELEMITSPS